MLHARDKAEASGLLASLCIVLRKLRPVVAVAEQDGFLYLLVNECLDSFRCRSS